MTVEEKLMDAVVSVRGSVWGSVEVSVEGSVWASVETSVRDQILEYRYDY